MEENLQRQNLERQAKEQASSSSSTLDSKSKEKGKVIMESPARTQPSLMIETLHKGSEFKKSLAKISSWIHAQSYVVEP